MRTPPRLFLFCLAHFPVAVAVTAQENWPTGVPEGAGDITLSEGALSLMAKARERRQFQEALLLNQGTSSAEESRLEAFWRDFADQDPAFRNLWLAELEQVAASLASRRNDITQRRLLQQFARRSEVLFQSSDLEDLPLGEASTDVATQKLQRWNRIRPSAENPAAPGRQPGTIPPKPGGHDE